MDEELHEVRVFKEGILRVRVHLTDDVHHVILRQQTMELIILATAPDVREGDELSNLTFLSEAIHRFPKRLVRVAVLCEEKLQRIREATTHNIQRLAVTIVQLVQALDLVLGGT